MEAAIRGALERAGIPGAQARLRIYESARIALDRSLERQGIADPGRVSEHRQRLEELIADIEAEWTPPSTGTAVRTSSDIAAEQHAGDLSGAVHSRAPAVDEASNASELSVETAPMVASPQQDARAMQASASGARLDFAPDTSDHLAVPDNAAPMATDAPLRPEGQAARPPKPARKPKVLKSKPEKRRRPIFASIFSAAVMLSFLGIGVWWLIESGALKTAAERDTGVPNPPPSLSRDDFAGGPQQLRPGSGFSGEWASVYTPGRDGAPVVRGKARAEVIEEVDGNALRITSGIGSEDGEVLIPLGADVMQALAGRQSALAISIRSASSESTQIYVKCQFSVLGECGRRRFDVTYETSDILFSLDFDRALAPNEAGYLIINSDISGAGKAVDLLAVRIRPAG